MTITTTAGTPPPKTDPELIALIDAARAGDMNALGDLYGRYHPAVHDYIRRRVADHYLAEDLAADTFVKVLRKIGLFTWQGRNFEAWLFTIARNTIADHYRSPRTRETPTAEMLDTAAEDSVEETVMGRLDAEAAHDAVHEALDALPAAQRQCLTLRFLRGKSLAATAESMGVAFGSVKMMQFRSCKALRGSSVLQAARGPLNPDTVKTLAAAVPPPAAASPAPPSGRERGDEKPRADGAPHLHVTSAAPAQQRHIDAEFAQITAELHDDLAGLHAQLGIHDHHAGDTSMSTDTYRASAERFARDIGPHEWDTPSGRRQARGHEMTILHDDGLYRHLRFRSPDRGAYWFDLVTWPGCLAVRGDFGDGFTFARQSDMFAFFREPGGIDPDYWSQKLDGPRDRVVRYDAEIFVEAVKDRTVEAIRDGSAPRGIGKAVKRMLDWEFYGDEHSARRALEDFEHGAHYEIVCSCGASGVAADIVGLTSWRSQHRMTAGDVHGHVFTETHVEGFRFHDTCEWSFSDYDWPFLWACHAITWGIAQYDAAKADAVAADMVGAVT